MNLSAVEKKPSIFSWPTEVELTSANQYHSLDAVNHSMIGAPWREVYFMGLIDVLTQYDTKKKAAHAAKAVKHGVRHQGAVSFCCFETSTLVR